MKNKNIKSASQRQQRFFELAKRAALESIYGKLRHGAVIVKGGSIVSFGFNKSNHCQFGNRFRNNLINGHATQHAEISAVLGMPRASTEGADIYVVRVNNQGKWRMSKPCSMCEDALKFVGVKRVFYTTSEKDYDSHRL